MINIKPYQIVYTDCVNIPFCFHVGITCMYNGKLCVFHNTPTLENNFGGNVICQTIEQFLQNRKLKSFADCNITTGEILQNFENVKFLKWNGYTFNCETYINQLLYESNGTTQLQRACNLALLTLCLI